MGLKFVECRTWRNVSCNEDGHAIYYSYVNRLDGFNFTPSRRVDEWDPGLSSIGVCRGDKFLVDQVGSLLA